MSDQSADPSRLPQWNHKTDMDVAVILPAAGNITTTFIALL